MLHAIITNVVKARTKVTGKAAPPETAPRAPMVSDCPEMRRNKCWSQMMNVRSIDHEESVNLEKLNCPIKKEIEPFEHKGMKIKRNALFPPLDKDLLLGEIGNMKWSRYVPQRSNKDVSLQIPR